MLQCCVCPSICHLSVMLCIVAKWRILKQKLLLTGNEVLATSNPVKIGCFIKLLNLSTWNVSAYNSQSVVHPFGRDWLIEHGFTSAPTQYRLYGRRFLQVWWPNQQFQSTEGGWLVIQTGLNLTRLTSRCYNNTTGMQILYKKII